MPTSDDLRRELWQVSYPSEPFDEAVSLQDMFEDARLRHPERTRQTLTQLLTVNAATLPDWYETVFSMPWYKCYTLNIDDIESATQRKWNLARPLSSVSALRRAEDKLIDSAMALQFVHLNGRLDGLPHDVTFSATQYAERTAQHDPWYLRLVAELLSHPFVFIGTRLDEPPLWHHIELRRSKGARGAKELRPRSYLVTRTLPKPKQTLLAEFNVFWIPMSAEEFTEHVLAPIRPTVQEGFVALAARLGVKRGRGEKLPVVADLAKDPLQTSDYLLGREPIWADIQSGRAIEREYDKEIWKTVHKALSVKGPRGIIVFTGTAGSGKTTALMRACLRTVADGTPVAWIDRNTETSPRDIVRTMKSNDAPPVLAIDDADMFGADLASMLRDIALAEHYPLVLVEVRSGKVDRFVNRAVLNDLPVHEVGIPPLTDTDIGGLIDSLDRENRLGVLKGKPRAEQEKAFRDQAGRQLLVAMYQATSNMNFEEKAAEELFELEGDPQFVYGLAATATAHRYALSKDEIVIAVGDRSNATLNVLDILLRRHLLTEEPNGLIRARHRVIAQILLDALTKRGQLYDILFGLILAATTKLTPEMPRSARPQRVLRTFLNHELLFRTIGVEQARNLYGSLEPTLTWQSHYWLQRGSLEVENGDLGLAENFLSQARGLAPEDPYVENEWAYLLFKKAQQTPGAMDAPNMVAEATKILEGHIISRRSAGQYPYHVLGSQGLSWARRGIRDEEERTRYLRKLILRVEEGHKRYPFADELKQLLQDLRHELLSLATTGYGKRL